MSSFAPIHSRGSQPRMTFSELPKVDSSSLQTRSGSFLFAAAIENLALIVDLAVLQFAFLFSLGIAHRAILFDMPLFHFGNLLLIGLCRFKGFFFFHMFIGKGALCIFLLIV